jgi:hypothetical protein
MEVIREVLVASKRQKELNRGALFFLSNTEERQHMTQATTY